MAMIYDGLLVLAIVLTTTGLANLFAPRPELAPDATTASWKACKRSPAAPIERALY